MAVFGNFLDGGSIWLFSKGKQNMGVQNVVRQALLNKEPQL